MSRHPGVTERRLNNKRFRKTEDAIMEVFLEYGGYVSVGEIVAKSGVRRSTVYYHHARTREILPNYKRYILRHYTQTMGRALDKRNMHLRMIYLMTLAFVVKNRKIFMIFVKVHDMSVMHEIIGRLRGKIEVFAKLPKNSEKMFRVYQGEVVAVLERWGEGGYLEEEMAQVLDDIMYLTKTIRLRLKPLMK